MTITDSIETVKGIGKQRAQLLQEQQLNTVGDLLNRLPTTYEDSTRIYSLDVLFEELNALPLWQSLSEKYATRAFLSKLSIIRTRRGLTICKALFQNVKGSLKVYATWFNQPYIIKMLSESKEYFLFGKVKREGSGYSFQSPLFEEATDAEVGKKIGHLMPIYRRIKSIRSNTFRQWYTNILEEVSFDEYIPDSLLHEFQLTSLTSSYRYVHAPESLGVVDTGFRRLSIQELCEIKQRYVSKQKSVVSTYAGSKIAQQIAKEVGKGIALLPFALTQAQEKVLANIVEALAEGKKLDSFIYGDVGSGKTVVVLLLAQAFMNLGYSVVFAAPTSILASQHVETVQRLFRDTPLANQIELVTGKSARKKLDATNPRMFIGTHALLFRDFLSPEKIALSIIDEQHRFGVAQREQLTTFTNRHAITLSATPIPRTLALSFLGFSAAEEITEKPIGRKDVITKVVPFGKETDTYIWVAKRIEKGERVYLVFPRVEDDETSEKQSLHAMAELLKEKFFSKYKTATMYGGMKEQEKLAVMDDFSKGKLDLLFATSVIEVGIDVPEATTMVIHGAEYFGLAQLHQLRGRVGRSDQQSYCFLLSQAKNEKQFERLQFFSDHSDGLSVSEYDLKNRGAGTLLDTVQSGESELKIATLQDLSLIKEAMDLYSKLHERGITIPLIVSS